MGHNNTLDIARLNSKKICCLFQIVFYFLSCFTSGFMGIHCEVNINECLSMPCENNSTCEDITAGYVCYCTPGWQGQNCQDNIDDCASEPCLNGADCMDLHNG
jgi:Notch-like protein